MSTHRLRRLLGSTGGPGGSDAQMQELMRGLLEDTQRGAGP